MGSERASWTARLRPLAPRNPAPPLARSLARPEIERYLDGAARPTLAANASVYAGGGVSGAFVDYFPQHCEGVYARTLKRSGVHGAGYLGDLDTTETGLLKASAPRRGGVQTDEASVVSASRVYFAVAREFARVAPSSLSFRASPLSSRAIAL